MNTVLDTAHEIIAGSDVEFQQIKYLIDFFLSNLSKQLWRDFQFFFLQPKSVSFFCPITQLRRPSQTDDDKALDGIMHSWLFKPLARNVGFGKPFMLD